MKRSTSDKMTNETRPQKLLSNKMYMTNGYILFWTPGTSLQYGDDEVREYRRNLMWWLVNHDLNKSKDAPLGLLHTHVTHRKRRKT